MVNFREANLSDIKQLMAVRLAVNENKLSDPLLITHSDYEDFITKHGKGWVSEINNLVTGFAVVDLKKQSVWALFVSPEYEGQGIGKKLHNLMLNWYFNNTHDKITLETAAETRAERFYKSLGWKEIKREEKKSKSHDSAAYIEIKFEMSYEEWNKIEDKTRRII